MLLLLLLLASRSDDSLVEAAGGCDIADCGCRREEEVEADGGEDEVVLVAV